MEEFTFASSSSLDFPVNVRMSVLPFLRTEDNTELASEVA